jgi:membrane glycosyltransferase
VASRMRQSLAQIEEDFRDHMEREQTRSEKLRRQAVSRTRKRTRERAQKRTSMRYWMLVLTLVLTAVAVTAAMFETLYLLLS